MFANTMDVDYSLEEFARVLVANGYISDDSCFTDADVPFLLSAFDTNYVLAPENFPENPYNNGEIPRTLEMSHVANQSLFESSLQANLADTASRVNDVYPSKDSISILQESVKNISTSSPHRENYCSNNEYTDNKIICNNISFNIATDKNYHTKHNEFHVRKNLVPHSVVSHLEDNVYHDNDPYITYISADQTDNVPTNTERCHGNDVAVERDSQQSHSSGAKQKKKRRNKGYSKPTKSRKRKSKAGIEMKSQPKTKKQKVLKDRVDNEAACNGDANSFSECADILQEDSGFESGDKNVDSKNNSCSVNEANDSVSTCSETVINSERNKALRRSSRSTRNTENYNLRLSSLVKRVETERRQQETRPPKDKTKPAPLSKYRRRTANARERDRMKEINDAFENLKNSLPSIQRDDGKMKVTKFTILKHALNYIASLREVLNLETILPPRDDDTSSDFSSVQPASVTSSGGEDSCSSPTSGHSVIQPMSSKHISSFCVSEGVITGNSLPIDVPY